MKPSKESGNLDSSIEGNLECLLETKRLQASG